MTKIRRVAVIMCFCYIFVRADGTLASEEIKGSSRKGILTVRASAGDEKKTAVLRTGETVKLECAFQSQSWYLVQWVKLHQSDGFRPSVIPANQTYTNGSMQISTVVIEDVAKENAGNYSCISTSGNKATTFEFRVVLKESFFCDENPCLPRGECVELISGYVCSCHPGFIGKHCELKDPCRLNPCLNGGNCTSTDNTSNCSCADGFGGDNCEREICTPTSCNLGGSCSESSGGNITCNCRYDRAGERCQHRCTFSTPRSTYRCRGKTCIINATGQQRCECHRHTHSNYCIMESEVRNECADLNICNGHGNCIDYTFQYRCECYGYSSGKNCEFYNECNAGNHLCNRYGGRCVDLPIGYKCINCPTGQHGDKCQYKPNACTVSCGQDSMTVNCDMRFLDDKLSSVPIYFNGKNCLLQRSRYGYDWQGSKSVNYGSCGTNIKYEDGFIVYTNSLRSGESSRMTGKNDIITRTMGHFRFDMECRIPLYGNTSGGLTDLSLLTNETAELKDDGDVNIKTSVAFYKENWESITKYVVGDRLYVKLYANGISNSVLQRYGILLPVTCFATADRAGNGPRYFLLENGCITDETFQFEKYWRTRERQQIASYFSFDSFSFNDNPGKLYLHCDARICLNRTKQENDSNVCKISCRENEVDMETTISTTIITIPVMSTSSTKAVTSSRKKRSVALLSRIGNLLWLDKESNVVNRKPGPVVWLGQGTF